MIIGSWAKKKIQYQKSMYIMYNASSKEWSACASMQSS